jgi:hypothetical protein
MNKNLFYTKKYIHLAILPFILGSFILFWFVSSIDDMLLAFFGMFSDSSEISSAKSIFENIEILSSESFLFKIVMILGDLSLFLIGTFLFFILFGVVGSVIQALFAPFIVNKIVKEIANDEGVKLVGYGDFISDTIFTLKEFAKLIFFLFIAIPLFFIPLANIVIFHLIIYKFFHNTMQRDVSVHIFDNDEIKDIKPIYPTTIKLYLLSLVPILNLFVIVYQIVAITTKYTQIAKNMRG